MQGLTFALLTVLCTALLRMTLKHCAVNSTSPWSTLILYHIGGALVLIPFLGLPTVSILSSEQIILLMATGVLFALGAFLDVLAMKHIDASTGEIFHTLIFIVSVAAGFLLFDEACSTSKIIGTVVIAAGILYEARRAVVGSSRGFIFKLGSAAFIAAATVITKFLTSTTPPEIIILTSFVLPGMIYLVLGWRDVGEVPSVVRASNGIILLVPMLDAAAYTLSIKALSAGEISTTYIIFQTTISAVFLLEVLLHGWKREVYLHRAISAGLCMCGALIAVLN